MGRVRSIYIEAAEQMNDVMTAFAVTLPVPIRRCSWAEEELEVDGRVQRGCEVQDGVKMKEAV